ncbi:LPS assembly lipoprotein LptE [Sphingomonas sp.]|uniref:LPS assembly lipoprotein LptE n=1 Tax=Sphingomonas sp. TaxID=28214 RepID=UPI003AFF9D56
MRRLFPLFLLLGGCGLHPLYGGGPSSAAGRLLATVSVDPIDGQAGWLVRHSLIDRLGSASRTSAEYRLEVELDDQIVGLGINDQNTVTRERRTLRARYRLVDTSRAGVVVVDATAGADAGIDVTSSDYSTLAAEQKTLENVSDEIADQIVARLALYARRAG